MAATAGLYGRLNRTSTRGFLAYVAAAGACAAVLACFVISAADSNSNSNSNGSAALRLSSPETRVWPVSPSPFCLALAPSLLTAHARSP